MRHVLRLILVLFVTAPAWAAVYTVDQKNLEGDARALLAYRRRSPSLRLGDYAAIDGVPAGCFAHLRTHPGSPAVAAAVNFTGEPMTVPGLPAGSIVVSTGMDRAGEPVRGSVRLGPHEAVVVEAG